MVNVASMLFALFALFLINEVSITASDSSVENIVLTSTDSQCIGGYPRNAINITLNISSPTNISDALEQCVDAGRPFLFVQKATLLGCGTLLWVNESNLPSDSSVSITLTTLQLNATPNGATVFSPNGTISKTATIQPSNVMINMTTNLKPTSCTHSNGASVSSQMSPPNSTVTISPSNVTIHMASNVAPLNSNQSVGNANGTQISPPNGTITISPSTVMVRMNSNVVPLNDNQSDDVSNATQISVAPNTTLLIAETVSPSKPTARVTTTIVPVNGTVSNGSQITPQIVTSPINGTIVPSKVIANATNSLVVSNGTLSFNGTEMISTNGYFSGTSTVLQSNTMVYNLNSNLTQNGSPSPINFIASLVTATSIVQCTHSSCQTSKLDNSTELVKAYKTEVFGEVTIAVFSLTNYTICLPNTGNLSKNCSFIAGDGTPIVSVETNGSLVTFSHRYFSLGKYRARVTCVQNSTVLVSVSRRINVSLSVEYHGLSCPDRFQTNKTYFCVFNVDQASELDVDVNNGNNLEGSYRFPETTSDVISAENATNEDLNDVTSELYSPLLVFRKALYVRCLELVSNISGTVNLKVFRPVDEINDVYTEATGNMSCLAPSANKSTFNASICFQSFTSTLRNGYLATTELTAVHNMTVTVGTGYNFLTLPDDDVFKAEPGDVIATSTPVLYNQTNTTLNASYSVFENFSLYGFVPYEARIFLRFMDPGILPLEINIRESKGFLSNFKEIITIQQPAVGLVFNYKDIIRVNTSSALGFELSRGTNASCDWLLTGNGVGIEGSVNSSSQRNRSSANEFEGLGTSFQYAHDVPGTFVFSVNCSNKVSTISENVTISVRRNVSGLTASLCFASFAYTHAQTCFDAKVSGDRVRYTWKIEKKKYHTSKVEMIFEGSTLPGDKTQVSVISKNVVSRQGPIRFWLDVLNNPLNIQILPALTVASQSNVNITATVNWSPYPNGTAFYSHYGINISQSLRYFIESPKFRVKINKELIAANISNGTLLTHKFPAVGSRSKTYDVYIDAIDHQEMNREIELRVVDRIENLRIEATCSNEIFLKEMCSFTAKYDGSDVICNWTVGSTTVFNKDKISREFDTLGNFTVFVNASNQISAKNAVLNLRVVPAPVTSESSAVEYPITSTGIKFLPTSSAASSFNFTAFTDESLAPLVLSSTIKLSMTSSIPISSSTQKLSLASITSLKPSTTVTSLTLSFGDLSGNTDTLLTFSKEINASPTGDGSSSRSIDSFSKILKINETLKSTVLDPSKTASVLSSEINPSSTKAIPVSQSIDPVTKIFQITGPKYAAVGEMVTFYSLNIGSFTKLSWFINNTLLNSTNNNISYKFNHPGEFKLFANASTIDANQTASFTVHVQEPISGFRSFVYQKPLSKRVDVLFAISSGTGVSYSVDFGDGSETSVGEVRELSKNVSVSHLYAKPGLYNISVSVFSTIGPNNTERMDVFINDTCELKSVVLYGASVDFKTPNQFTDNDEIVMAVKTVLDCAQVPQFKYRWKVVRLNSSIPNGIPIQLAGNNGPVFEFSAKRIATGDYKISVTVENCWDGSSLTRYGYFSKIFRSLDVFIACGDTRMASVAEPQTLNATVITGSDDVANLQYLWFCDHVFNITCFGDGIQRNMSGVRFPGNFFSVGEVYEFVVRVRDGTREAMASQRITFGLGNITLDLCLSFTASQDNKPILHPTQDNDIIPSCPQCSHIPNPVWSWRVLETASQSNFTTEIAIENLVLNSSKLHIPASTLQPNTLYKIHVNITSLTRNISAHASYKIRTNDIPLGGYCDIQPYTGSALLNAFQTSCYAWYDRDQPLSYEYWYSTDGAEYNVFYNGKSPVAGLAFFEAGVAEQDFIINVKVVIRDSKGEASILFLKIKNLPPSDSQIEELLNSSLGIDSQVENLINVGDTQSAVQFLKTVSSVLNDKSSVAEDISKRIEIRETVFRHLKNLCCSDSLVIKQTADTMLSVSSIPSELNLDAQLYASTIYLNLSQTLNLLSTKTESLDVGEKVAMGVSLLLSAVSLLSNKTRSRNTAEIKKINADSLLVIDKLGDTLLKLAQPGEPAIILTTSSFTVALQKHRTAEFPGTRLNVPNEITQFMVPRKLKPIQGSFVSSKMVLMSNNTILVPVTSPLVPTSGIASLVLVDTEGKELKMNNLVEPFNILLDYSDSHHSSTQRSFQSPTAQGSTQIPKFSSKLSEDSNPDLYEINTTTSNPSVLVTISQISTDSKGQLRMRIRRANQSSASGSELIVSTTSSFPVSLTWRGLPGRGTYHVSIEYESLSFRLAGKANEIEYSVSFREVGCYYWNVSGEWKSNGCKVGLQTTTTSAHCECNHLTWFGARVIVPPNTISFTNVSERIKDPRNYVTILSVLCSLLVLYCLILVWAGRRDIQDKAKNGITWCSSNQVSDSHQYQVIIYTGIRRNAGTTANVGLMLSGELGKSRKCLLKSSKRETLKRGHVDSFLITATGSLGPLEYIHVWHDNTGSDPAWFLNRVVVLDSETGQVGNFLCYRWLAVDEGDGQIQRLLPLAGVEDLRRFRHLFVSRATSELTDAHLWFSVAFRPASSPFTRVERVSCCLALLLTSMMANAMWYKTGGSGNAAQIDLGLFTFSWDELFIGVCSSLIVFPVNLLLVQIFRHCRSKNQTSRTRRPSFFLFQNGKINPVFLNSRSSILTLGSLHGSSHETRNVSPVLAPSRKPSEQHRKTSVLSYIVVSPRDSRSSSRSRTSLFRRHVDSPTQGTHKDNQLPSWCQYIGWFGVVVTCSISTVVTFLYAIEFGEKKTRKWLLSLAISLVNDVFIAQPSKVLIVTVILAYILKRPLKERYVSDDVIRKEVLETTPEPETEVEAPDFNLCTTDECLRAARGKRKKDKFMYGLMKDVFSHFCFTVIVLIIAYSQRDVMGYYLTSTQENTFVYQDFCEKSLKKQSYDFFQVANVKDFWIWNKAILIPGLFNNEWYNYTTEWSTFTANFGGFLFGAARMRQERLKKDICDVLPMFKDIIPNCSGNYEWSNEDKTNYETAWRKQSGNNYCSDSDSGTLPPDQWCYSRMKGYITAPYIGRLETYSGGGYSQDLGQNYEVALNLTRELREHNWIDKYTRAVFVEFTLYNPNVNLFSIVTFLFEISSSGDFNPVSNILSIRLYNYVGNFQIFVVICQLFFLGFLCAYTYKSAKGIFQERCRFFLKAWNFYEFLVVLISWLAVAIYFVAIVFRKRILQEFRQDPTKFTSFRYSASWQMTLEYVIACLVFMIFLKFLRLFQFNRRMFLLPLTLSNTAYELLSYTVVFSIVLMSFSLLYHLALQAYNPNFASIIVTIETLLRVLLGKSDVLVKNHQFPVLERVFIFIYMCLMKFILLNIFVTILNDGFKRARAQNDTQQNTFEFIDYVKNTVNELLGIRRLNVAKTESVSVKRRVRFEDDNSMHNVEYSLRVLDRKVGKLLKLVHSESFQETFNDETWH